MKKLYSLLLLFISVTVFAQSYNFTVYNTQNSGIASNNVNDFKQSSSGTLWIATNNGLSRMVGNTFTNYNTSNSAIGTDMLNKVAVAGTTVWISTYGNGIIRYNGTTFTNFNTNNPGMPNNTATGIATDGAGNLWMASSSGLSKFNGTTWTTYNTANSQIVSNNVTSVFTDSSNNVWLSASGALMKFNGTTFTIVNDQVEKILKVVGTTIYVDTFDGFGKIVGTDYTGFYLVNNESCLASCGVEALGIDETNKVWLGLENCGNYAGGIQRFTDCTTYRTSNSILPDNNITSINVIDSNVIWAGTLEGGLVKINKTDGGCGSPTGLGVYQESISTYAAQLYWTPANPTTTGYTYYYNTVNQIGGQSGQTSESHVWIDQLQPNTTYYWWVASACEPINWVSGGSFTTLPAPVDLTCFVQIAAGATHSMGIKADGTLWAWGANEAGQLGIGNQTNQSIPKQVGTANNWQNVSAGLQHTVAIKTNGTLWAWGSNANGRLGNGVTSAVATTQPVQIGTATNWKSVEAGEGHTIALKTNGTLWGWGFNAVGSVGDGSTTDRSVPVQIGTGTTWQNIYTGAYHSFAMKTDGTLWAWGLNAYGQLGDGTTVSKSSPVQIAITGIVSFAAGGFHAVAVKTNGTLWAWGNNEAGQVGNNTIVDKSTPAQIGTSTTWTIAGAGDQHSMAVTANGVLYSWGLNSSGQLGIGSTTNKLVPTYVNSNFDGWTAMAGGYDHTIAMLPNGKLWVAGSNTDGQLGVTGITSSNYLTDVACPTSAPLSNNEFEAVAAMKVYPNPVNDMFTISLDREIDNITIYNLLGQEVITKVVKANEAAIDVSGLGAGTYFVKAASGNDVKTSKIIKK